MKPRRFPPPWTSEETEACFIVKDGTRRALAYVYYEEEPGRRTSADLLTKDEGRSAAGRFQYCQVAEIQDGWHGIIGNRGEYS